MYSEPKELACFNNNESIVKVRGSKLGLKDSMDYIIKRELEFGFDSVIPRGVGIFDLLKYAEHRRNV